MYNVRPEDKFSGVTRRNSLQLNTMRECLQNRRLHWFVHLEKLEESSWHSKCQEFQVDGSLAKGQSRKTWSEVIRRDLENRKVRCS